MWLIFKVCLPKEPSSLTELSNLIHEHQPDIIFGTGRWLFPTINPTEFFPPGYSLFRKDQSDGHGGAFKKDLTVIHPSDSFRLFQQSLFLIWKFHFLIILVYVLFLNRESHQILIYNQRTQRSCETQLISAIHLWF